MTVYSRSDCYLCNVMVAQLREFQPSVAFEVEVVEIDGDGALEARYGKRVPVLVAGADELCHYRLDRGKLGEFLKNIEAEGMLPSGPLHETPNVYFVRRSK